MTAKREYALERLREDGHALWDSLTSDEVGDIREHLMPRPVYDAHVRAKTDRAPRPLQDVLREGEWPSFSHEMDDVVCAPHFFERAVSVRPLAQAYFGVEHPVLYSFNVFWTQPSARVYESTHHWHRDFDDERQLVLFLFGTDVVRDEDGAHLYQRGTHHVGDDDLGRHWRSEPPSEIVSHVMGRAGTTFLADTSGLHMGVRPTRQRMLAWARWGISDQPRTYVRDQLRPAPRAVLGDRYPKDPALRRAVRLVVQ